ncbi:MAG: adenylate/guanylate cyclase domain-containing protein [Actinomycetota bacterium]
MTGITREKLAHRAGAAVNDIDRLVDIGIITPGERSAFSGGDVWRARFLLGMEQGGLSLQAVGAAVQSGDLSFEFFDAPYWDRFGGLRDETFADVNRETGLSLRLLAAVREASGYASPSPDDRIRVDELAAIELLKMSIGAGIAPDAIERQLRVWGESIGRIADADANFWHEQVEVPFLEAGLSHSQMLAAAGDVSDAMSPLLDPALLSTYHAQSEHTWMAGVVEAVEATLEKAGLHESEGHPPAMCFLDVSGYTRLTEERGDAAAADVSSRLGELVGRSSRDRAGRPVKWLGDGVMVHFKEPAKAVGFALEMRDEVPTAGLPPVHVGIAAGPLIYQSGDYFGRTVNLASRIAAYATADQVLVDDQTTLATTDQDVAFDEIGPVELKGVAQPVRLSEARRLT